MSTPPRGSRGGRPARSRGSSRGGASASRSRVSDGNESDTASIGRRNAPRGRGRGNTSHSAGKSITQAFQQANRQQDATRGSKSIGNASRVATSTIGAGFPGVGDKSSNETPDQRFQRLKSRREIERTQAQTEGLISGDKAVDLKNAITIVGTCQEMCAEFERARRILQKDVAGPERITMSKDNGEMEWVVDESKMVKKFQRSAAGIDEQLPSDLRPPAVLLKTADYLFNDILSDEESLQKANMFIWDRTRAIRNDFSIQQVKKLADVRIAIECYEKIARYHILSLHQIGGRGQEYAGPDYNWQQDREQLDKTLLSLLTYYEHVKQRYRSPNEVEFRSYWILFQIGNVTASVEEKVQTWSMDLLKHSRIRRALDIYAAASDVISVKGPLRPFAYLSIAQQNWQKFWNLIGSKQTSYLMSCVAEIGFNIVRRVVLTTISMTYNPGGKKEIQDWTLEKMTEVLGFDEEDTTRDFIEQSNLMLEEARDGSLYLKLTVRQLDGLPEPSAELPKQLHSWHLVERKRFGRSWPAVIAGMSFKAAKDKGMLVPGWNDEIMAQSDAEDGLFLSRSNKGDDTDMKISEAPAQSNPFGNTSSLAAMEKSKPATFNPFGAPSALLPPATSSMLNSAPAPFGKPTLPAQSLASAAQASTGSFGPLPSPFSFPAGQSNRLTGTTSNPFAGSATSTSTNPAAANPFAKTPLNTGTESLQTLSNPFTAMGASNISASTPITSSPSPTFTSVKGSAVPSVQVTPPELNDELAKPAPPKKVTFDFSSFKEAEPTSDTKSAATPALFPSGSTNISAPAPKRDIGQDNRDAIITASQAPNESQSTLGGGSSISAFSPLAATTPVLGPSMTPISALDNSATRQPFAAFPSKSTPTTALGSVVNASASDLSGSAYTSGFVNTPQLPLGTTPLTSKVTTVASPAENSEGRLWEQSRKTKALDYMAEQLVCDLDPFRGYFKQYVGKIVEPLIKQTLEEEALRQNIQLATSWRSEKLMMRYGLLWKRIAITLKSRRKRLEMKQRNAEARLKRSSVARGSGDAGNGGKTSLEKELAAFRAEQKTKRNKPEETIQHDQEHQVAGLHDQEHQYSARTSATNSFDLIGQRHVEPPAPPEQLVFRGHQRSKTQPHSLATQNDLRHVSKSAHEASPPLSTTSSISSIARASLINGGSLIDTGPALGKKASTMQSPYFRLKAAGFGPTWTKGPPLIGTKRSRLSGDDIFMIESTHEGHGSAVPATKRFRSPEDQAEPTSPTRSGRSESLTTPLHFSTSSNGAFKRSAEDEELFARVRRLREALDEGENWFKGEVNKDELRRSQELRLSQLNSRPQSQGGLTLGPNGEDLAKLPRFYSRVSKFVPREEYGVRRAKIEIKDEPSEKEKVNGVRPSNRLNFQGRQLPSFPMQQSTPSKGGTSWDDAIEL